MTVNIFGTGVIVLMFIDERSNGYDEIATMSGLN